MSDQQPEPGGDLVIRVPAASAAATAPQNADETQNADEEQADGVD